MTPECEALGLWASPISSDVHVETLRQIRNACRDGFAHDNAEISPLAQRAWWVMMRNRVKGWIYHHDDEIVGYALLRMADDGRVWTSIGVLPAHMGQGYGGAMMADLLRRATGTVWSEARLDNPAALGIHRSDDWEPRGDRNGLRTFEGKAPVTA